MKLPTSRSFLCITLVSIASTQLYNDIKCEQKPFLTAISDKATSYMTPYFETPFWQNTYGIASNLCQIGSICGSGFAWLGQKGLAGTYWTTELIKNNPKIATSLALYTAWYMGQKRWAQDVINRAQEFLNAKIKPLNSFSTWRTGLNQYPTIFSIMSNLNQAGTNLLTDYDTFNTNSFCTCLKNAGNNSNKKALAIKLALEMEYKTSKEILELFTKDRNIWLTNVPYWIEEYIKNSLNKSSFDIFTLYTLYPAQQEPLNNLEASINAKIASTGLPTTRFVSEKPSAYWNWMRREIVPNEPFQFSNWLSYKTLNVPLGFIWPYEHQASMLYWGLFNYNQRVAALHSAILAYIRAYPQADGNPAEYNLNQFDQINQAIKQFLSNSSGCNAQYCINKLQAQQ